MKRTIVTISQEEMKEVVRKVNLRIDSDTKIYQEMRIIGEEIGGAVGILWANIKNKEEMRDYFKRVRLILVSQMSSEFSRENCLPEDIPSRPDTRREDPGFASTHGEGSRIHQSINE